MMDWIQVAMQMIQSAQVATLLIYPPPAMENATMIITIASFLGLTPTSPALARGKTSVSDLNKATQFDLIQVIN